MHARRGPLTGAFILALTCSVLAGPDSSSLLFETPALLGLPTGTMLFYRLERTIAVSGADAQSAGSGVLPSMNTVELSLQADAEAGGRQAKVEIITGERRQAAGLFPSIIGNPVLLVLLERDVLEMSRILRGSPYYIRNRIREALRETTLAEPARFLFNGREVEGWRVAISPFAKDRNRDRLREHAARRYEFILSDAVPGGLYEVRMMTPGPDGASLVEDRLVFARSQSRPENVR